MGSLGGTIKAGFDVKKLKNRRSVTRSNGRPRVEFIMTIEGLMIHPIEVEVNGFSFGPSIAAGPDSMIPALSLIAPDFTIQKGSDACSLFMQQAWMTGKAMQVSITAVEHFMDDRLKHVTYAFSNAFIKSFQSSGSTAAGIVETIQFDSEQIEVGSSPPVLLHELVHSLRAELPVGS